VEIDLKTIDEEIWEDIELFEDCKRWKKLPGAGGVLDQEACLMEIFRWLDYELYEHQVRNQETGSGDHDE